MKFSFFVVVVSISSSSLFALRLGGKVLVELQEKLLWEEARD